MKQDGHHKERLISDGHLNDLPSSDTYSGVVSLRGMRIVIFLAELNSIPLISTDIGNSYLQDKTQEKV